jgi:Rrf2 family iron-sulfur cluster assembly transcriptional regulator
MALVDMANQNRFIETCDKATCLSQIAGRQGITVAYLEQIFCKLKSANIVKSQRGPGGGYILARPALNINIAEIIIAVDEPLKMTRCGDEKQSSCSEHKDVAEPSGCMASSAKCSTHELWEGLEKQIENYLSSISLDDVVNKKIL